MTEAWQIGGYRTDTLAGKVVKVGTISVTLNASGASFKVLGVDYQVTAGKTFHVTGIWIVHLQAADATPVLRYADDAAMTTNPVAMGYQLPGALIEPGYMPAWIPIVGLTAPATKYVGLYQALAAARIIVVSIIGYEV